MQTPAHATAAPAASPFCYLVTHCPAHLPPSLFFPSLYSSMNTAAPRASATPPSSWWSMAAPAPASADATALRTARPQHAAVSACSGAHSWPVAAGSAAVRRGPVGLPAAYDATCACWHITALGCSLPPLAIVWLHLYCLSHAPCILCLPLRHGCVTILFSLALVQSCP